MKKNFGRCFGQDIMRGEHVVGGDKSRRVERERERERERE